MEVDLESQTVSLGNGKSRQFDVDPFVKHCLLNGLDEISLTLQESGAIDAFESHRSDLLPVHRGRGIARDPLRVNERGAASMRPLSSSATCRAVITSRRSACL